MLFRSSLRTGRRDTFIIKAGTLEEITSDSNVEQIILYDDDPEVVREVQKRLGRSAAIHWTWRIERAALVAETIA